MNPALGMASEGSPPAVVVRKVQEAELDEMLFSGVFLNVRLIGGRTHASEPLDGGDAA